jgi:hypothetical protein
MGEIAEDEEKRNLAPKFYSNLPADGGKPESAWNFGHGEF